MLPYVPPWYTKHWIAMNQIEERSFHWNLFERYGVLINIALYSADHISSSLRIHNEFLRFDDGKTRQSQSQRGGLASRG